MWFRLHPPFGNRRIGEEKIWEEIDLSKPISVRDFLNQLLKRHPELDIYVRQTEEETFYHMLFFRQNYVLRAEDKIRPEDRIDILMPLTGG